MTRTAERAVLQWKGSTGRAVAVVAMTDVLVQQVKWHLHCRSGNHGR